jgi:hypothetical protein
MGMGWERPASLPADRAYQNMTPIIAIYLPLSKGCSHKVKIGGAMSDLFADLTL